MSNNVFGKFHLHAIRFDVAATSECVWPPKPRCMTSVCLIGKALTVGQYGTSKVALNHGCDPHLYRLLFVGKIFGAICIVTF